MDTNFKAPNECSGVDWKTSVKNCIFLRHFPIFSIMVRRKHKKTARGFRRRLGAEADYVGFYLLLTASSVAGLAMGGLNPKKHRSIGGGIFQALFD
jgi:hypothetical protein